MIGCHHITPKCTCYNHLFIYLFIFIFILQIIKNDNGYVKRLQQNFFFPVALWPNVGHGLLILEVSRSHTMMHHSRQDSSGRVISSSQRPLPDNTQHSQQTNIHAPGGIRTHDLSRRAAADLRLRPSSHWDRRIVIILSNYLYYLCVTE